MSGENKLSAGQAKALDRFMATVEQNHAQADQTVSYWWEDDMLMGSVIERATVTLYAVTPNEGVAEICLGPEGAERLSEVLRMAKAIQPRRRTIL